MRYLRNQLYINSKQQTLIEKKSVLMAGAGLGSVIAETLLRLGFENLTIIDGDRVEETNLNRQNFIFHDIGDYKVEALHNRLRAINPEAQIKVVPEFLTAGNIDAHLAGVDIAINTLDFDTDVPFIFDERCNERSIPIIHPFNLGWMASAFIVDAESKQIRELEALKLKTEVAIVSFILESLGENDPKVDWLRQMGEEYQDSDNQSPPQLAVASQLVAGLVTSLVYKIANNQSFRTFPYSYFSWGFQ